MTTNFFQNIASLNLEGVWKLAISTDGNGNITVSQLFNATCGDKAAGLIVPLTLSGTAEELDGAFFDKVTEPTLKAAGLQANMEAYLKSVEAAKAASKLEQDKKSKEKKPVTTAPKAGGDVELPEAKPEPKEDRNKVYMAAMQQVDELTKKFRFSEALAALPAIADHPNKENELKKKSDYLKKQSSYYEKVTLDFNEQPQSHDNH